jgi:hypothetical protein
MLGEAQDRGGIVGKLRGGRIVEALRPVVGGVGTVPGDPAEVVDDVAAGEDHDAALPQRRQPGAEVEMEVERLQGVDRKLDDRQVGLGIEMGEDAPRAVVEPPLVVVEAAPDRLHRLGDLLRQLRRTRRGILKGEQLRRETVEIVDRARPLHGGDRRRAEIPVGRYDEQRPRPRQSFAQRAPGAGEAIPLERVHRAAMADEQSRHPGYCGTQGVFGLLPAWSPFYAAAASAIKPGLQGG